MTTQTIFALSSAKGKAGVSVFRISGSKSYDILRKLIREVSDFKPNVLKKIRLINPQNGEEIDEAMAVFFKAPFSFTGEDVVELHTHGSHAVAKSLTEVILKFDQVRYAENGEFTKRAVLNGKMDLTRAEGLMDLINAETAIQYKQALNQMKGALYEECVLWRSSLISIMSLVEAFIDFPDEEIPNEVLSEAEQKIANILALFTKYLNDKRKGERLRNGLRLTIFGKPNVGKSSLINFLSMREIAIVSSIAGTTRDIIEAHIDINGYPIILTDTAGIHDDTDDEIELEGIKRAKIAIENADIKIFMQDTISSFKDIDGDEDIIYVLNKIDLYDNLVDNKLVKISLKEKIGLDNLLAEIAKKAELLAGNGENIGITQNRHRVAIQKALESLERVNLRADIVLAAEDLRLAAREISKLIGKIDVEDILSEVFSTFCIGK